MKVMDRDTKDIHSPRTIAIRFMNFVNAWYVTRNRVKRPPHPVVDCKRKML
jgi:hypothetical protein